MVYQLIEKNVVKAEGTLRTCWGELLKQYKNCTIIYLTNNDVRIEPKS